jgi:hypothetical protein
MSSLAPIAGTIPGTPILASLSRGADGAAVLRVQNAAAGGKPALELRIGSDGAVSGALEVDGVAKEVKASAALGLVGFGEGLEAALSLVGVPLAVMERALPAVAEGIRRAGRAEVAALVDAGALAALAAVRTFTGNDLAFHSASGERGGRRRQAATAAPLFAADLSGVTLKIAVDRAKPLSEALLKWARGSYSEQMSSATVKRLCAVREAPTHGDLRSVCAFAAAVPHDWIPSSGPEWASFCLFAHAVVDLLQAPARAIPALVKGCSGKWTEFRDRVAREAWIEPGEDAAAFVANALSDARDMVSAFADVVAAPLAAHASGELDAALTPETRSLAREAASDMLVVGRNAPSLVQASRRWHHQRGAILEGTRLVREERRRAVVDEVGADGWPPLTAPVQAPNGLWVVPLGNSEQILHEGLEGDDPAGNAGLNHCVGSYSAGCQRGDSHIASVREMREDGTFKRISTVEFGPLGGPSDDLVVRQNRGWDNRDPETAAFDAVSWFVAEVRRGSVKLDRERLEAYHERMRESEDGVRRFCGYDWTDREQLNAAVAPWGPFVTGAFKGHGLDDLLACPEIARASETFAPSVPLLSVGRR